jgi:hypothetical protein
MKPILAEDILSDGNNYLDKDGLLLRKGTVAAAIANAKLYLEDRVNNKINLKEIQNLNSSLKAIGLYDVLTWKDEELKELLDPKI